MMAAVTFFLVHNDTGMYYAGRDYTKPKWTKNIQKAQGYHDIKCLENMARRLGNVKRVTVREADATMGLTNLQRDAMAYQEAKTFLRDLGNVKDRLTPQELRTLKGQALSGDVNGATKGLARLLAQKDGRAW